METVLVRLNGKHCAPIAYLSTGLQREYGDDLSMSRNSEVQVMVIKIIPEELIYLMGFYLLRNNAKRWN
ncbi:hypothetical protein SUGI_0122870 [Cryptomeria japonica]|nr:hypothetical protein SUGI_0122870 [Cryptomeria japonica]